MKKVFLTIWLIMPLLAVAVLCWWILASLRAGPAMHAEAVGQGARDTGGANAIGEMLARAGLDPTASHAASLPNGAIIVVRDTTGIASESRPIFLASAINDWAEADEDWQLNQGSDGRWVIEIPQTIQPFEFRLTLGSWESAEQRTDAPGDQPRFLPRSSVRGRDSGNIPMLEVEVTAWSAGALVNPDG